MEIPGSDIVSQHYAIDVWHVDHVLLTPRQVDIPLGKRERIIAEVTSDAGHRATNVLLNWKHDADDPLIVRIRPTGWVIGNRLGRTTVTAGAGDPDADGVWARIPADVSVIDNPDQPTQGSGIPTLLITGDVDPTTGERREGDPEQPALWQEAIDFQNNIWWLNLENAGALFHFNQIHDDPAVWRAYHAQKVVEVVIQVHMTSEYSRSKVEERPEYWAGHKATLERFEVEKTPAMWERLGRYIETGQGLEDHVK